MEGRVSGGVHLGMELVFEEKVGDESSVDILFFEVDVFNFGYTASGVLKGFDGFLVGGVVFLE